MSKALDRGNVHLDDAVLILLAFEDEDQVVGGFPDERLPGPPGRIRERLEEQGAFDGERQETYSLHPSEGDLHQIVFAGLGKRDRVTPEVLRRSIGRGLREAPLDRLSQTVVSLPDPVETDLDPYRIGRAYQESVLLSTYKFDEYRSESSGEPLEHLYVISSEDASFQKGCEEGRLYARGTNHARDLGNEPPSRMDPDGMVEVARELESEHLDVRVLREDELREKGMEPTIGVSAGSDVEPAQILLKYRPDSSESHKVHVGLAGKGVTFDSGGLNLKPLEHMMDMKFDMCGAAAVLGVFHVIDELQPDIPVTGICGCTENMTGPDAQKMRDVVTSYGGTSIEITHTDAEGRLVLSDALPYLEEQGVTEMIDLATLTGSVVTALGSSYAGLMSPDDELQSRLEKASENAGEQMWELPLEEAYESYLDSPVADVRNTGKKREAGAIIAGLFLQKFVEDTPWAHLDIAGTAWRDDTSDYRLEGGTGYGVRTLLDYVQQRAEDA